MLGSLHPGHQRLCRVVVEDRHGGLRNNRAGIQLRDNEVYRRPMDFDTGIQSPLMSMQPGKSGQQRRMNVNQPVVIPTDKLGSQDTHETGQHDHIRPVLVNQIGQRGVKSGSIREITMVQDGSRYAHICSCLQARRVGSIADHTGDFGRPALGQTTPRDLDHVRAATGN